MAAIPELMEQVLFHTDHYARLSATQVDRRLRGVAQDVITQVATRSSAEEQAAQRHEGKRFALHRRLRTEGSETLLSAATPLLDTVPPRQVWQRDEHVVIVGPGGKMVGDCGEDSKKRRATSVCYLNLFTRRQVRVPGFFDHLALNCLENVLFCLSDDGLWMAVRDPEGLCIFPTSSRTLPTGFLRFGQPEEPAQNYLASRFAFCRGVDNDWKLLLVRERHAPCLLAAPRFDYFGPLNDPTLKPLAERLFLSLGGTYLGGLGGATALYSDGGALTKPYYAPATALRPNLLLHVDTADRLPQGLPVNIEGVPSQSLRWCTALEMPFASTSLVSPTSLAHSALSTCKTQLAVLSADDNQLRLFARTDELQPFRFDKIRNAKLFTDHADKRANPSLRYSVEKTATPALFLLTRSGDVHRYRREARAASWSTEGRFHHLKLEGRDRAVGLGDLGATSVAYVWSQQSGSVTAVALENTVASLRRENPIWSQSTEENMWFHLAVFTAMTSVVSLPLFGAYTAWRYWRA